MSDDFNREWRPLLMVAVDDVVSQWDGGLEYGLSVAIVDAILALPQPEKIYCSTVDHENVPAVRYMSCEEEGSYPYCAECAGILLRGGFEVDRGPVSPLPVPQEDVTDEMATRAVESWLWEGPLDPSLHERMKAALVAALSRKPGRDDG